MKKFLITLMCVVMIIAMMPAMAMADVEAPGEDAQANTPVVADNEEQGTDTVVGPVEVDTYDELIAALREANANVKMTADIKATATQSSGYGVAGIVINSGAVLDGDGHKLTINGANATWDCAVAMTGGEVKNLTISGAMRGVFMPGANGDVVIDNCVLQNVIYTFNSDDGNKNYSVTIKNTKLYGWTSFSNVHKSVTFENCIFGEGYGYAFCRPYQGTTFTNCSFASGYKFDTRAIEDGNPIVFKDCTYNGIALSADNNDMFYNGGSVTIDGAVTDVNQYAAKIGDEKYTTLAEAVAVGGEVDVLKNIDLDAAITVTKNVTINLGGNTIAMTEKDTDGSGVFHVTGGTLTINGEGTVNGVGNNNYNMAIWADGGNVVINGGKYTNIGATATVDPAHFDLIYVKNGSTVTINGGTFECQTSKWTLNSNDSLKGTFVVKGGTFKGYNPAAHDTEPAGESTNWVDKGYVSVSNGNDYTVRAKVPAALSTNIGTKTFKAGGDWVEFTFTTTANDDAGLLVIGGSDFGVQYESKIAGLEYKEGEQWRDMKGQNFGGNGFPMTNATSTFRVKFTDDAAGTYTFTASMKAVADHSVVCSLEVPFTVQAKTPSAPPIIDYPVITPTPTPSAPKDEVVTNTTTNTDTAGETVVAPTTNANVSASTTTTKTETGEVKTETKVEQTVADKIVEKAVENKSEEVVIDTTTKAPATGTTTAPAEETKAAEVVIPTETIGKIAEQTEAAVTIKTDVAEIKLDNAAATAIAQQAAEDGTISIVAVKTDEVVAEQETVTGETEKVTEVHFELKVVCSERGVIGDFQGGQVTVTVPVPKDMHTEELVAVYIDAQGHYHRVTGVKNANGTFSFTTDHFSSYAVMTAEEAEAAIEAQKAAVKNTKFKLNSKLYTRSNGKKAIKLTWSGTDLVFDGVEFQRSMKKNSGYGKTPYYTTKENVGYYNNTAVKEGNKYYYRARGFVTIDGEKVYTQWSYKAWRTVK